MTLKKLSIAVASSLILLLPIVHGVAQEHKTAEASIPFEFWVGGNYLPAGIYQIEGLDSTSYFLLRSADGKTVQSVYALPVDDTPARAGAAKLVFRVDGGRHYLYGSSGRYGRRVSSVESTRPVPAGNARAEVPITYR